jgi:hypothetical protein
MEENRDISEFNGAQLKMFRIDEAIKGINACRHDLNIQQWLFFLQDFDMELESVKKKEEIPKLKANLDKLQEQINSHLSKNNNPYIKVRGIPAEIIGSLNEYQKELLKIFKESGLEMKLSGDSMSNFGRG